MLNSDTSEQPVTDPPAPLLPGSLCCLMSGGPIMTLGGLTYSGDKYECYWFDEERVVLSVAEFHLASLVRVDRNGNVVGTDPAKA